MASKHLVRTTATVQDVDSTWVPLGAFKTFSGGGFTSSKPKSTPAAGEKEIVRRGRRSTEDVTIGRENDGKIDLNWLKDRRGQAMQVARQNLDDDGNPFGAPITYTGKLADVNPGDGDAEAQDDLDDFTLTMACDE